MEKSKFIWMNGKMVPWGKAKVHFINHSLHYGSGVFEGIRCYETPEGPAVFRLKDHVKRFFFSAGVMGLDIQHSEKEIYEACKKIVSENGLKECYIRPLAYFGSKMGLDTVGAETKTGIAAWAWGAYLGEEGIRNGVSVKISPFTRPPRTIMPTHAKVSGNYVNSIIAKMDALKTGYKEAILLDIEGNVSECTGENLFVVKDSVMYTPTTENALDGITRKSIIQIAKDFGIEVRERELTKGELMGADEAFMTGTAAEITPISSVDGNAIGEGKPGEISQKMVAKYSDAVHGKEEKYKEWLDFV